MPISNNVFPQVSGVGSITLQNDISDVTSTNKATTPKYVKDLIDEYILDPTVLAAAFGASTDNIALTGPVVYEGLTIPSGVRWLAAGQTDPITNGVYITDDAGDWTRATDADTAIELHLAQITAVNGDAGQYLCTISKTAVVGTDPVTFIELYKADDQYVGIELYNPAKVYNQNTLVVNPSVSEYIWRCLINGTNNIVPSMASNNWEIYQGLLYQNSAVVAPNGNDSKSVGFPYATYAGAIADLSIGGYIEGRAVTTVEAITPKSEMYIAGKNSQASKVVLSANNVIIDGLNLLGSAANPVPISIVGATNSTIRNLTATANGADHSIEVTGAWDGVHRLSDLRLAGNINIAGTTTTGVIVFSDILSTLTLTLNCANAIVFVNNCPNFTLVETSGSIIYAQSDKIGTLTAAGTIPTTQELTICTAATATYLVTLPSASISRGRLFKVKNSSASAFAVTITVNSKTYSIQPDEAMLVESDGTNFQALALPISAIGFTTGDTKTGMQTADHNGWLIWTNGRSLSRTTYAKLWAFVQSNSLVTAGLFGNGDGSTTFTLGDINGRSIGISGSGSTLTTRTLGAKVGAETNTLTINEIPSHKVRISMIPGSAGVPEWNDPDGTSPSRNWCTAGSSGPNSKQSGYSDSIGGGAAHNNMQPSIFLNMFVYSGV